MQKKPQNFSPEQIKALMRSPAGQQLLQLLQQQDPQKLRSAADRAAKGDYAGAGNTLNDLLASPEAKAFLKQLGGK